MFKASPSDTTTRRARALALLCSVLSGATPACARIMQRYPEEAETSPASAATQLHPPIGAQCRLRAEPLAADLQETCDAGASTPTWTAWSERQPAGLCYVLDEPCEGLADHIAYLTFDDGPSDWTLQFLDILARKNVLATFFVNARGIKGAAGLDGSYRDDRDQAVVYRQALKRIVDDGHALGNHTADHLDLGTVTEAEILEQLRENELLVNRALLVQGGHTQLLSLLRAPFGSPWFTEGRPIDDIPTRQVAAGRVFRELGYNVLWNISSTDADEWAMGEAPTALELSRNRASSTVSYADKTARIASTVLGHALVREGKGIVVLMHDTHNATRDALPGLIDGLRARGYSFATLEQHVLEHFGRSSLELTPGPALDKHCGAERSRSCAAFTDFRGPSVCGRMWRAYMDLGAEELLGRPQAAAFRKGPTQIIAQTFEAGTLELRPELEEPCDALLLPEP